MTNNTPSIVLIIKEFYTKNYVAFIPEKAFIND